jgi:hypothetical protein
MTPPEPDARMFPAAAVLADAEPATISMELAVTTESRRAGTQPAVQIPPAATPAPSARSRLRDTAMGVCTTFRASGPPPDRSGGDRTDIANRCSG